MHRSTLRTRGFATGAIVLVVLSALALLFGWTDSSFSVTTPAEPPANGLSPIRPADVAPAEDIPTTRPPSAYCVARFLSPFLALAGEVPMLDASTPKQAEVQSDWLQQVEGAAKQLRNTLRGHQPAAIEVVIASVPDPIDSGSVYQFESLVQSIRAGFEESLPSGSATRGYFRDRSFSPWEDRDLPSAKRAESEVCRLAVPGVLLFRDSDLDAPRVLAVLLVGETPTHGLHGAALINALRAAEKLEGPAPPAAQGGKPPLRVIGPAFSGTAHSLRLALRAYARQAKSERGFHVISGTATGSDLPRLLRDRADRIDFSSTTVPEYAVDCAYLWFLNRRLSVDVEPDGKTLEGVATLHESGTEFGATDGSQSTAARCDWRAAVSLSFPVHVSFLRDAYEDLDRKDAPKRADGVPRATALEASLHEPRQPLDFEANPSDKTRAVMDVALSSVLAEISRRGVRHVGIHATNIGDAIFLARKIRDIAPDVRLAFFEPDGILLHPQYRSALLGSLTISPYPFLGVNDFKSADKLTRSYRGFTSAAALGVFNAVLAQRGATPNQLFDYSFDSRASPLPVWVSTIGRSGIVPRHVSRVRDYDCVIYGNQLGQDACLPDGDPNFKWHRFNTMRDASLPIDPGLLLPRFWNFLFMALVFAFAVDQAKQGRTGRRIARDQMPDSMEAGFDRQADRAIGRTKWWLYAAIRRFLFVLGFTYMGLVYALACVARAQPNWFLVVGAALFIVSAIGTASYACWSALRTFWRDYRAFARYVDARVFPLSIADIADGFNAGRMSSSGSDVPHTRIDSQRPIIERFSLSLGLGQSLGRTAAARISFAQLRLVAWSTLAIALFFSVCLICNALMSTDSVVAGPGKAPAWTMTVLRSVPLFNGISPAAPALLCLCCVYVWAVGRMARIALAHSVSRISPPDGETDLVSTPLRLVLYPRAEKGSYDEGFTRAERDLLNSIWRPITGRYYTIAFFTVLFFPGLLFMLKPLSTLEEVWGSLLLGAALALSAILIGVTLIQLIQYWVRLERVLKRTMAHPLGPVFGQLPPYVRDSVDHQVSRSPNELLRWVACARQYGDLFAALAGVPEAAARAQVESSLSGHDRELRRLAKAALTMAEAPDATGREEVELAERVIASASSITRELERAWNPTLQRVVAQQVPLAHAEVANQQLDLLLSGTGAVIAQPRAVPDSSILQVAVERPAAQRDPASTDRSAPSDALEAVAYCFAKDELLWLRQAQVYVATVCTLLIHKHVRQFRYFVSTLTGTALLLLLAVTSYPFEPYRLMLTCIWAIVGTVVAAGLWVYVQLDRNTLISLIAGTSPNRVTIDRAFVLRVLAWGVVPLVSVAAAQYPDVAHVLFQLIAPFTPTLR